MIIKLIKFYTYFSTLCFLPSANLSKIQFLIPQAKKYVNAYKPEERALGCSEIGRTMTLGLTALYSCHLGSALNPSEKYHEA